jgi:hypothetical protein
MNQSEEMLDSIFQEFERIEEIARYWKQVWGIEQNDIILIWFQVDVVEELTILKLEKYALDVLHICFVNWHVHRDFWNILFKITYLMQNEWGVDQHELIIAILLKLEQLNNYFNLRIPDICLDFNRMNQILNCCPELCTRATQIVLTDLEFLVFEE